MALQFYLFLPQVSMTAADLVERARAAEAAGFAGVTGMDHLMPAMAEGRPMFEAMVANTWVAAHTDRLRVGSLVLCNSFRHPAVLARQTVSIDHLSGGRFDMGIGWGSVMAEFEAFGIGPTEPRARIERLKETLEIVKALWSGDTVNYVGKHFTLREARLLPAPLGHIPIIIGGEGKKTLELIAAHADWWNLHFHMLDKLEELRPLAGNARTSVQVPVVFVPSPDRRELVTEAAHRPFSAIKPLIGTGNELVQYFADLVARGVERIYLWFYDLAAPETITAFGESVIRHF